MSATNTIDFRVDRREVDGIYDLVIEDGEFVTDNSFNTPILMSVFEERRADESEIPTNYLRRGFWGNVILSAQLGFPFEIGSKLWLLYQARKTQLTLNFAKTFLFDSLNWLVEDGFLQSIEVTTNFVTEGLGVTIKLLRFNNEVETKSFTLWENTGLTNL
jgi:phage gp46-like protein